MHVDYRERKFVSRNRPRRQPIGTLAIAFTAVFVGALTIGGITGWFLCKYMTMKSVVAPPSSAIQKDASSPQARQNPPSGVTAARPDVPLSFYETLPKGANAVIGSGMNPKHNEQQPQMQIKDTPAASQHPSAQAPLPQAGSAQKPVNPSAPSANAVTKQYTVQVASLRDKGEAEALRKKLSSKGLEVQIIENKVPDKGTWYRIRAGRHMLQAEAQQLAAKLGSGALAVPE